LKNGLKYLNIEQERVRRPLSAVVEQAEWQIVTDTIIKVQLISSLCARSDWAAATPALRDLKDHVERAESPFGTFTRSFLTYLEAMCSHGDGDLAKALALYSTPGLMFDASNKSAATSCKDLHLAAALNRTLVLRGLGRVEESNSLLTMLEPYCVAHHNKSFVASHHLLQATGLRADGRVIDVKKHVYAALTAARSPLNNQIMCMTMCTMSELWFRGIVGTQAIGSAQSSRTCALRSTDQLWIAVANKLMGDSMMVNGREEEAIEMKLEAEEAMQGLPLKVRQHFTEV
jgi:hypothetical protein